MPGILLVNPRKRRKARKSPRRKARRKVARRRVRTVTVKVNPRRRRKHVARRRRVARRRNPSLRGIGGKVVPTIKAGLIGAAGGLGLDLLLGYVKDKLPAQLQDGYGLTATKVAGAIAVGMLGNYVLRGKGAALATGAMTVVLHDELKAMAQAQFPTLPLGEYMSIAPAVGYSGGGTGIGEYMQEAVGGGMSGIYDNDWAGY